MQHLLTDTAVVKLDLQLDNIQNPHRNNPMGMFMKGHSLILTYGWEHSM